MRSLDFERIWKEFVEVYGRDEGERNYREWIGVMQLDESREYGRARESYLWKKEDLQFIREDADNKYYEVEVGFPWRSMNGNVYKQRDLVAAALTLKGKHPSLNHKDEFWFSPKNPLNRWGNIAIIDGKFHEGICKALIQVPKDAICPICNGAPMTELIDKKKIINVSLEGDCKGGRCATGECEGFYFLDPPFTFLTTDVLPGIPMTRIKPLESYMPNSQSIKGQGTEQNLKETIGEPCSPELKSCVDALIADGKSEESAWAICRSKVGEAAGDKEDQWHTEYGVWRGQTRGGSVTRKVWKVYDTGPNKDVRSEQPSQYASGPSDNEPATYDDEVPEPAPKPKQVLTITVPKVTAPEEPSPKKKVVTFNTSPSTPPAFSYAKLESQSSLTGEKRMKIKAQVKEDDTQKIKQPETSVNTRSIVDAGFRGEWGTPVTADAMIDKQNDLARTVVGTPAFADNTTLQSSPEYVRNISHEAKEEAEPQRSGTTSFKGNDTSQPRPEDIRTGPSGNTAPSRSIYRQPEGAPSSLPSETPPQVITGASPASGGVVTGASPAKEELIAEQVARIRAETREAIAHEETAKSKEAIIKVEAIWAGKHMKLLEDIRKQQAINVNQEQIVKEQQEAIRKEQLRSEDIRVEMRDIKNQFADITSVSNKQTRLIEDLKLENTDLNKKYHGALAANLELSQKETKANEDYLEIAKRLETANDALVRSRNEAKKILKISV